ncbi:fluoride efflux transporter CrcB [Selenomonas sp.]|uniref:fluoride efflux transporter CrcB n=2 Tax=Selenomonas sp. TaxID=2053611 RepID=UPI0025F25508|nr:fluoride efflux transporter CrcB [Selenomonas sp.]MCI6283819.1 fluoride efflux transporter CrcB [Selenomonas sp.]
MPAVVLVFLGGGLGAVCRYLVTTQVGARFGTVFPFGTLTVNTVGSFLMGLIMGVLLLLAEQQQFAAGPWKLLLTVGFLGGFTTFSSFSMETMTLVRGGSLFYAAANVLANLVLGFAAVMAGLVLGRMLVRG